MGRACNMNAANKTPNIILVGKPEGKRPLGNQDVGGWII
jgi:hypothetical protein